MVVEGAFASSIGEKKVMCQMSLKETRSSFACNAQVSFDLNMSGLNALRGVDQHR